MLKLKKYVQLLNQYLIEQYKKLVESGILRNTNYPVFEFKSLEDLIWKHIGPHSSLIMNTSKSVSLGGSWHSQ
jgi:hypothetical protein